MHNKSLKFFYILPHRYLNVLKGDVTLFDNMLWYRAKKGVNWLFQVMVPSRLINSNQTMREMSPGIENNCWFSRGIFLSASPASGGDIDVLFVIKVIDPVLYTSELKKWRSQGENNRFHSYLRKPYRKTFLKTSF